MEQVKHHTLLFSPDRDKNFGEIFEEKVQPSEISQGEGCSFSSILVNEKIQAGRLRAEVSLRAAD